MTEVTLASVMGSFPPVLLPLPDAFRDAGKE